MSARLEWNGYGKSRVRVMRVAREGAVHTLHDVEVAIQLEGDFESIHTLGDNAKCLPTDTMKNTVYVLAKQLGIEEIEDFALALAGHFLANHAPTSRVKVDVRENRWSRAIVGGASHPHTFLPAEGGEKRTTQVIADRKSRTVESGLDDLFILKTTGSAFADFPRDRWTTLPETSDRIFATRIRATWRFAKTGTIEWGAVWRRARAALVDMFAAHDESRSVQHTLHAMGDGVLVACPEIESIHLSLPNVHCLLFDLGRFGLTNPNEVFVPTDEPHGLIEARLTRG